MAKHVHITRRSFTTIVAGAALAADAGPIDPHAKIRQRLDAAISQEIAIYIESDDLSKTGKFHREVVKPIERELANTPPKTVAGAVEQIRWAIDDHRAAGHASDDAMRGVRQAMKYLERFA